MEEHDYTKREPDFDAVEEVAPEQEDALLPPEEEDSSEESDPKTYAVKFGHFGQLYSPDGSRKFKSGVWYIMDEEEYNAVMRVSHRHVVETREE